MVAVVVVDGDPARSPRSSKRRPAPANSGKHALGLATSHSRELERCQSRGRVAAVVLAREPRARASPARARLRARSPARARATARTACATSRSVAKVAWWSRSTFVSTAIRGRSSSSDRSDSSPSATSQPSPARAFPPSCGISPPIKKAGSSPRRSRRTRSSPWSSSSRARRRRRSTAAARRAPPATRRARVSSDHARARPELRVVRPDRAGDDHFRVLREIRGVVPDLDRDPRRLSRSTYEERARSEPPTSAPHACATSASALIPAPPIPTNQRRLPSSGRKRDQLLGDLARPRPGVPRRASHAPISARRPGSSSSERTISGTRPSSPSGIRIAPPAVSK